MTTVFSKPLGDEVKALSDQIATVNSNLVSFQDKLSGGVTTKTATEIFDDAAIGFTVQMSKVGASDNPTSIGNWALFQIKVADNYGFQLAMQSNSNNIYFRRKHSTWQEWVQI